MKIAAFYENILTGIQQRGCTAEEALAELKAVGLDNLYMSDRTLFSDEEHILSMCQEFGLGFEGLYSYFDFLHKPEDKRYEQLIDAAAKLGAKNVLVLVGIYMPDDKGNEEALLQNALQALRNAVAYGAQRGVAVTLEDVDQLTSPNGTIDGLCRCLEEVPGLQCSFDTGNFALYREDEVAAFDRVADNICTMHLKDRSHTPDYADQLHRLCDNGEKVYCTPVGTGFMQIEEILRRLKASGYDGGLIAELFDYGDTLKGIKESIVWMKETWAAV